MSHLVWGVDVSTKGVAIATAPDRQYVFMDFTTTDRAAMRLGLAYNWTFQAAQNFAVKQKPTYVLVERPAGVVHRSLTEMCGVVKAALWQTLRNLPGHEGPVTVAEIQVSEWKKEALGRGDAPKQAVMRWAKEQGYSGDVQDVADALAIATAGLKSIRV